MNQVVETSLADLRSQDKEGQNRAFQQLLPATDKPVDWAYEVWDELVRNLADKDNRRRAISAQVLCNLAKSDPEERMLKDFPTLLAVTKDGKFVTARHCMQSLWKVGIAGEAQRAMLLDGLTARFKECAAEKNCTLIRYDIVESLRKIYDETSDEKIRQRALDLIDTEDDLKYRKKYATLWKR
jgi:hypothetical protein